MLGLYQNDPLYLAIMTNDKAKTAKLKEDGIGLTEHIRYALTHGVGSLAKANEYTYTWYGHLAVVENMKTEELIHALRNLREALGEPMYYSGSFNWEWTKMLYTPDFFSCVLNCFDNRKMSKKWIWKKILDDDRSDLMAIAAEHGWIKMPKKRDELMKYASDNQKTECLAWLLNFKNSTADLALEQKKAEEKQLRELNANPNSVTELRKQWSYQKREDGTLIITSLKRAAGGRTEITVPEKIGKDTVAEIGDFAFSPRAKRLAKESGEFRENITMVVLPPSVKTISKGAFMGCYALEKINIPNGVESINEIAFSGCKSLKEITLPNSVKNIGEDIFNYCPFLEKIDLPKTLKEIPSGMFALCTSLEEILLPDGVCDIGDRVFKACFKLKKINIPDKVKKIGNSAFEGCKALEQIILPQSVQKIGQSAFSHCESLKTAFISEGPEEIGQGAFAYCGNLEKVYLPKSIKKIKNLSVKNESPRNIFYGCEKVGAIVCQGSYAEKYCKRNNIPYTYQET